MIVDHCSEQIVSGRDGVEITGEMQIDIFHRNDLGLSAARRTALHPEAGAKRRFAQAEQSAFTNPVHRIGQANAGGCLAFASGRRVDRRNEDQLAVGFGFQGR